MKSINEKKHLLLSKKEDAQLEDHIAKFIYDNRKLINSIYFSDKNDFDFKRYKDDDSIYIKLSNFIPSYLNTYDWLENDYEIHIYHNYYNDGIYGNCLFNDKLISNRVYNLIINVELDLNDFTVNELASFLHHELHHVYEAYNKVQNSAYSYYNYYDDFGIKTNKNFNNIIGSLYLVSPEERRARLENFYHEVKNKNFKDCPTYKKYVFNYSVIDFILNNIDCLDKDEFINYYGNVIEEILNIKKTSSKYFEKICKYLKRYTDDTIKRMKDIDNYVNNSKSDELLESLIYYHRKKNNTRNWINFERDIAKQIYN